METRRKSAKVVASVLALAGLVAFSVMGYAGSLAPSAPPAPTMKTLDEVEPRVPIHASDLPLTITESNSYYLVEDINFTSTANHAITIECNDVTIDLMGYTLKGPDSGTKCGIYMNGRTNVEVRNGTVRDFYYGIHEDSTAGNQHRIINVRAVSNTQGGIWLNGSANLIKDCTVRENGTSAADIVYAIYAGASSTVTGNTSYDNGDYATGSYVYGIYAYQGSTVTGNTSFDNGDYATGSYVYGIYARFGSTVTGNTSFDNGDYATGGVYGIRADTGCTVTGNTSCSNGGSAGGNVHGLYASTVNTVVGNTSYSNGEYAGGNVYGIYLGSYCLVDQNTAHSNGIEAVGTATNMDMGVGSCVYGINVAP